MRSLVMSSPPSAELTPDIVACQSLRIVPWKPSSCLRMSFCSFEFSQAYVLLIRSGGRAGRCRSARRPGEERCWGGRLTVRAHERGDVGLDGPQERVQVDFVQGPVVEVGARRRSVVLLLIGDLRGGCSERRRFSRRTRVKGEGDGRSAWRWPGRRPPVCP